MHQPPTDFLAYLNTLSPIGPHTWAAFQSLFSQRVLSKHEHFVTAGSVPQTFAFLKQGVIRTYYLHAGTEYNKAFDVAPGLIAGYASLISGSPSLVSLQALTDCEIWVAEYPKFTSLFTEFPELERLARRVAELAFIEKEKRELEFATLNASSRYQFFLQQFPGLDQIIQQYHIASYLGITPVQLSRIRNSFAKKKPAEGSLHRLM